MALRPFFRPLLPVWMLFFFISPAFSQPDIGYQPVISTGLANPIDIVNAGDGSNRLFVVQRGGTVRVYNAALGFIQNFVTVSDVGSAGEGGLLSMAFHPDYETNGFFFVYYTRSNFSLEVARYRVSPGNTNQADPASKQIVLNIPHPGASNHNGGKIMFGPDGYLYLATGDGGGTGDPSNNAQNGARLLGKMLRINVTTSATSPFYTIPADNPYVSDPAVNDEIWAIGLRNPFRWSFDRATGDMWIADVGQSMQEEINYRPANATGGINYGWRCYEGTGAYNTSGCLAQSNYISPVFTYGRSDLTGGQSVTGGFVYRGTEYASMAGYYIFADYISGNQWATVSDGVGGWTTLQLDDQGFPSNIVAFGEAENGTLYAASLTGNSIYKVVDNTPLPVTFGTITAIHKNNDLLISWMTETESNNSHFEIEGSADGTQFTLLKTVQTKAVNGNSSSPLNYEIKLEQRETGITWGLSLLALLALSGFRKRWGRLSWAILLFFTITSACNKNNLADNTGQKTVFIRIAQIDKDGTKQYAPVVRVVNE